MAVVVVGDFPDPAAVLGLIQQHLGPAFEEAAAAGLLQLQGSPEVPAVLPDSWQHSEPRCVYMFDTLIRPYGSRLLHSFFLSTVY
jgi:hypothetical protein